MPSTIYIEKWIGATGSQTQINITNVNQRMTTNDENASGSPSANPIPIPLSGVNASFWQNITPYVQVTPSTSVQNVKWYTSGVNPFTGSNTGSSIVFSGSHTGSYIQAYGTVGTTGVFMVSGSFPWAASQMANMFTYTSASPLSITGSLSNPNTGSFAEFVTYQAYVSANAVAGQTSQATFTIQWDEQ
jgi:hypothetical protein